MGNLTQGFLIAVIGIITVLIVLFLIILVLSLFNAVTNWLKKKDEKKSETNTAKELTIPENIEMKTAEESIIEESSAIIEEVSGANLIDDLELVAVITAAIAQSLNTGVDKLIVRSIRKSSSWKKS